MRMIAIGCALGFGLLGRAWAEPPRMVWAVPDLGDVGVDPATKEIRIEFDQDMSPGGRSICGGGPSFPVMNGQPRWETARVLVIPVKLEAEHTYEISINCPSAMNFKSVRGESAEVSPISFRTGKAGEVSTVPACSPETNRAAVDAMRRAIDVRYSYRDRVVKDWEATFTSAEPELLRAQSRAAFARRAARMLAAAEDLHMALLIGKTRLGTYRSGGSWNVNPGLLSKVIPGYAAKSTLIASGRFEDGIGYISIASLPGDAAALEPAHTALNAMMDAPAIILDLRTNGGGDELTARQFAQRFVAKEAVYSLSRVRDESGKWTPLMKRAVAAADGKPYTGKVCVLMGPGCVSSCESFLLMMRHGAGATLVGDVSRGSSGNPKPVELGNGVTLLVPTWEDHEPDGTVVEGRGVLPDVKVNFVGKDRDEVLEAALKELRKGNSDTGR